MEKMAMGVPNIQQQLYLKTALNESKDGMFDHPVELDEGNHKKSLRLIRAGDWERAAEQGDRAEASGLMRGGASKRTMKDHFNNQNYAAGTRAQKRFDKAAAKKRDAALKAKGLAEQSITEGLRNKMKSVLASISEASPAMDRASKILRDNERAKISPAEMKWLKKQKAILAKIKPKYAPGQDPVVNSRKKS